MSHATKLDAFLMSYDNSVAWGKLDKEAAVHRAIDSAFPYLKDDEKADLYALIMKGFEEYDTTRMVSRRMWLGSVLRNWQMSRGVGSFRVLSGSGPTAQEQQQATASGKEVATIQQELQQPLVDGILAAVAAANSKKESDNEAGST